LTKILGSQERPHIRGSRDDHSDSGKFSIESRRIIWPENGKRVQLKKKNSVFLYSVIICRLHTLKAYTKIRNVRRIREAIERGVCRQNLFLNLPSCDSAW
jgi:hypothetical protein